MATPPRQVEGGRPDGPAGGGSSQLPGWVMRAAGAFRPHLLLFLAVNGLLLVANVIRGGGWWSFWPALATGLALGLHYLVYKVATVDERWAEARAEELHLKSYDRGHIQSIATRGGMETPADRPGQH